MLLSRGFSSHLTSFLDWCEEAGGVFLRWEEDTETLPHHELSSIILKQGVKCCLQVGYFNVKPNNNNMEANPKRQGKQALTVNNILGNATGRTRPKIQRRSTTQKCRYKGKLSIKASVSN